MKMSGEWEISNSNRMQYLCNWQSGSFACGLFLCPLRKTTDEYAHSCYTPAPAQSTLHSLTGMHLLKQAVNHSVPSRGSVIVRKRELNLAASYRGNLNFVLKLINFFNLLLRAHLQSHGLDNASQLCGPCPHEEEEQGFTASQHVPLLTEELREMNCEWEHRMRWQYSVRGLVSNITCLYTHCSSIMHIWVLWLKLKEQVRIGHAYCTRAILTIATRCDSKTTIHIKEWSAS